MNDETGFDVAIQAFREGWSAAAGHIQAECFRMASAIKSDERPGGIDHLPWMAASQLALEIGTREIPISEVAAIYTWRDEFSNPSQS